jgi:2-succinyl-6-hydroxy-2,4-cyclohexadiene-1-carboxylate synthase
VEQRDIDVGDELRLHVTSSGSGFPLLLLHGFTGSSSSWNYFRSRLESTHRVIAVDLPGHGRSSAPTDPLRYTLARTAKDLTRVLDELELEQVAVYGYSMGGRAAIRLALDHQDRVAALILESTSPGIERASDRAQRIAADMALADQIEKDGIEAFVARWEQLPLWENQKELSEATRRALREQRIANDPHGLANSLRGAGAGVDADVFDRIREIDIPTLILAGELDTKYVALGRQMVKELTHGELKIVEHAGHSIHLEQPDAVIHETLKFLSRPEETA